MITVKNVYKSFDDEYVLNDVSVTFEVGKCNMIIGRSGSGKTVLLKSIVGLLEIDQGEIWYDDRLEEPLTRWLRRRRDVWCATALQGFGRGL